MSINISHDLLIYQQFIFINNPILDNIEFYIYFIGNTITIDDVYTHRIRSVS